VGFRGLPDETQGPNNGADDNGSGTVLILEMARAFQAYVDAGGTGSRDRRSVLFAAWGAEEEGLLGSCNYVHYIPAVPLGQTRALMNFDMVGRLRENTVYLSGGDVSPAWGPMARNANDPLLNLAFGESSCTGCTDHACFWQAGIPFMGFFTGLHNEYHRPGDDIELIDFTGMVRIGNLSLRVLSRLTVTPSPPPLTKTYPSEG
jgi:Zn-dependent M28 family amino/carboxypeptidase